MDSPAASPEADTVCPTYPVRYDIDGRAHLVVTALDAHFVVSARIEPETGPACWHFGYTKSEQRAIADLLDRSRTWHTALIMLGLEAVEPELEGPHPSTYLTVHVSGDTGWAEFVSDERREDGSRIRHLTALLDAAPEPIRRGRDIYDARPTITAASARTIGSEYVLSGRLSTSVRWQRPSERVPQGPFGREVVPEEELPPRFP